MVERPDVYDTVGTIARVTARQVRLCTLAETRTHPPEISEFEAVLLLRWLEFAIWLDLRELRRRGVII